MISERQHAAAPPGPAQAQRPPCELLMAAVETVEETDR
jgi:hypothetical protein